MKDWDWYSGKDIEFNRAKPVKPCFLKNHTSAQARKFADALEVYEKEFAEYQDAYKEYRDQLSERYSAFKPDLFKEAQSSIVNKDVFSIVYDASYDRSHSGGFQEVYNEFYERVDFIEKVMQAMK